jgi:hypothetical protein
MQSRPHVRELSGSPPDEQRPSIPFAIVQHLRTQHKIIVGVSEHHVARPTYLRLNSASRHRTRL